MSSSFVENVSMLNWIAPDNCSHAFMLYHWGNINQNLTYDTELFVVSGFRLPLFTISGSGAPLANRHLGYSYVG